MKFGGSTVRLPDSRAAKQVLGEEDFANIELTYNRVGMLDKLLKHWSVDPEHEEGYPQTFAIRVLLVEIPCRIIPDKAAGPLEFDVRLTVSSALPGAGCFLAELQFIPRIGRVKNVELLEPPAHLTLEQFAVTDECAFIKVTSEEKRELRVQICFNPPDPKSEHCPFLHKCFIET